MKNIQLGTDGGVRSGFQVAVVGRYPLLNGYISTLLLDHAGACRISEYTAVEQLLSHHDLALDALVMLVDQYSNIQASEFSRVLDTFSVRRSIVLVEQGSQIPADVLRRTCVVMPMSVEQKDFELLMAQISAKRVPDMVVDAGSAQRPDPCLSVFTSKQRKVLSFLREGMSNKQIGIHMHVTEGTIKAHLRTIYSITGCRGRINTALMACRIMR